MTIEKLILLRKALVYLKETVSLETDINHKISLINSLVSDLYFDHDTFLILYQNLLNTNNEVLNALDKSIVDLEQSIIDRGLALSNESVYSAVFCEDNINNVTMGLDSSETSEPIIKNTIFKYVSWQHPALYFHYKDSNLDRVDYLVSADPLYLAGSDKNFLSLLIKKYPELYQRRVRIYKTPNNNFSVLPQEQFGFIFCWDFFNYLLVDHVEQYLKNILTLLKPGGVIMFSYTNADLESTAIHVDAQLLPWCSKTYLEQILISTGFEIVKFVDLQLVETNAVISWVEAKRPGNLSTIKRSPVLGQICQK